MVPALYLLPAAIRNQFRRSLLMLRTLCLFLAAMAWCGCTSSISFHECVYDEDCNTDMGGAKLFCTPDGLCVRGTAIAGLCAETYPTTSPSSAVVIGALVNNDYGNDRLLLNAYKLAIDQVNTLRRPDPPLVLHICEISASPDDPLKSMQVLVRERNAVAVMGPTTSRELIAVADEVIRGGVPLMSPGATSPEITSIHANGLFYRVAPSDVLQGPELAGQLQSLYSAGSKLALLYVNDSYGLGLMAAFQCGLPDAFHGLPPALAPIIQYEEPVGGPDPTTVNQVSEVLQNNPDFLVAITNRYSDTVLVDVFQNQNMNNIKQIVMGEGGKNENVLNLLGRHDLFGIDQLLQRVQGTAPTANIEDPLYMDFEREFKLRWTRDDPSSTVFTAYAYDAIYAIAIAVGAAGANVAPDRVSMMLSRIDKCPSASDFPIQLNVGSRGYVEAKNKLRNSESGGLVLHGLSGDICFDQHGDRVGGNYERWWIDNTGNLPSFKSVPISFSPRH